MRQALSFISDPRRIIQAGYSRAPVSLVKKIPWDAVERPHYAYGLWLAARTARSLGIADITAIEFGVAGGNGLTTLERYADDLEREMGVGIQTVGFDTGSGMPAPADFRDLPYVWQQGDYAMDIVALRQRLRRAQLLLGEVAMTLATFMRSPAPPVGFVVFDLDYYSSTVAALGLFDAPDHSLLPRVICYFDDIIGGDDQLHCEYVGELLAIREFNIAHDQRKIARINGLRHKRRFQEPWNDQMFVMHAFDHPLYGQHLGGPRKTLELETRVFRRQG